MLSFKKVYLMNSDKMGRTAVVSAATVLLIGGGSHLARPAVFEQTRNGSVIEVGNGKTVGCYEYSSGAMRNPTQHRLPVADDGQKFTSERAPSVASSVIETIESTDASAEDAMGPRQPPSPPGSSAGAAKRVDHSMLKDARYLSLPSARPMPKAFTASQQDMYWLAAKSGQRFAMSPGVRKSRLDKATFINLFTAMIQRESNFNPHAVSRAGAVGLGQLMPGTARELGVKNRMSAHQNLEGSVRYLSEMLDRFGSTELALAAYNAGPGTVSKFGGIPPYRETRQYVSDVLHAVSDGPHDIKQQVAEADTALPSELLTLAENDDRGVSAYRATSEMAFATALKQPMATNLARLKDAAKPPPIPKKRDARAMRTRFKKKSADKAIWLFSIKPKPSKQMQAKYTSSIIKASYAGRRR